MRARDARSNRAGEIAGRADGRGTKRAAPSEQTTEAVGTVGATEAAAAAGPNAVQVTEQRRRTRKPQKRNRRTTAGGEATDEIRGGRRATPHRSYALVQRRHTDTQSMRGLRHHFASATASADAHGLAPQGASHHGRCHTGGNPGVVENTGPQPMSTTNPRRPRDVRVLCPLLVVVPYPRFLPCVRGVRPT